VVVLHAEPRSAATLAAIRHSSDPWIVAVNMVSEGVDIPRLRVGVYATAAKTALVFRQIVGRFVRTLPGRPADPSWLYVPADPILRDHAATIEQEVRAARRRRGEESLEEQLDPPERRQTERTDPVLFEPLSADVAPQMTLFGPAPTVARNAAATADQPPALARAPDADPDADPDPDPAPASVPAYERRGRLRSERHRLVSDLTRRDRTSHREVNAWLNREVGITKVQDATIEQLERSIELLERRLSPRR
jgi:superfamily II DNA or RNA helicase